MNHNVETLCANAAAVPFLPTRIRQASERLRNALGTKTTSTITKSDLDNYLHRAAGKTPKREAWHLDGVACFDILMLGTFALAYGDELFWHRVEDWLAPHRATIVEAR